MKTEPCRLTSLQGPPLCALLWGSSFQPVNTSGHNQALPLCQLLYCLTKPDRKPPEEGSIYFALQFEGLHPIMVAGGMGVLVQSIDNKEDDPTQYSYPPPPSEELKLWVNGQIATPPVLPASYPFLGWGGGRVLNQHGKANKIAVVSCLDWECFGVGLSLAEDHRQFDQAWAPLSLLCI